MVTHRRVGVLAWLAAAGSAVLLTAYVPFAAEPSASPADSIRGWEGLYDSLASFQKETTPCVILIDPSDPAAVAQSLARPGGLYRLRRLESRITALSGLDCFTFHYTQLRRDSLERPNVKAIVLRAPVPSGVLRCEAAREELWAMLRQTKIADDRVLWRFPPGVSGLRRNLRRHAKASFGRD